MKRRRWMTNLSVLYLAVLTLCAAGAPLLTGYHPVDAQLDAILLPPQPSHLLGTDEMGRDVLTRFLYGGRVSLAVGCASAIVSLLAGVAYGMISGYCGGWIDRILMRAADALLSIPSLLFMIGLQALLKPSLLTVVLVIGLTGWMPLAKLIRTEILALKEEAFIQASAVMGATPIQLFTRHFAPHCLPTILVMTTAGIGHAILSESTLSFLGLGIPPHEPSWGNMLAGAQNHLLSGAWWAAVCPGLGIALTVLAFTFLGDDGQQRWGSPQFYRRDRRWRNP